jgi:hypothetical protein
MTLAGIRVTFNLSAFDYVMNDPVFSPKFESLGIGLFPERLKRGDRVMHDADRVSAGALVGELTDSSGGDSII